MTTWPGAPTFVKTNVDGTTDDPSAARADIHNLMSDAENMIGARGVANGVASLDAAATIPVSQLPTLPFINGIVSFQTQGSFTWTVPAGVTRIYGEAWGAGGGGGYGPAAIHGGGGGAGGGAVKVFTVTPGQVLTIAVGLGGQGGASPGGNGNNGGNSTLTVGASTITGVGGQGGFSDPPFGGYGGISSGGDVNFEGGTSMTGITGMGGMGGSNPRSGPAPGNGTGWGFGGGGYGSGPSGSNPAIPGKDGGVLIQW